MPVLSRSYLFCKRSGAPRNRRSVILDTPVRINSAVYLRSRPRYCVLQTQHRVVAEMYIAVAALALVVFWRHQESERYFEGIVGRAPDRSADQGSS